MLQHPHDDQSTRPQNSYTTLKVTHYHIYKKDQRPNTLRILGATEPRKKRSLSLAVLGIELLLQSVHLNVVMILSGEGRTYPRLARNYL